MRVSDLNLFGMSRFRKKELQVILMYMFLIKQKWRMFTKIKGKNSNF